MSFKHFCIAALTLAAIAMLPVSCTQKGGEKRNAAIIASYETAQKAQDYQTACAFLVQLAAEDSASNKWAYDSLAFYHYFYLFTPGTVRNTHTGKYYAQKGLDLNPANDFLQEIKAKLELEEQKVGSAEATFQNLWRKTNDYTYWWILSFIEAHAKGNLKKADSMITMAITEPAAKGKTVRMEHIQERIRETVSAKAAFLYLKATLLMVNKDLTGSAQLLNEALKESPDFYAAKRSIYDMTQGGPARPQ